MTAGSGKRRGGPVTAPAACGEQPAGVGGGQGGCGAVQPGPGAKKLERASLDLDAAHPHLVWKTIWVDRARSGEDVAR